MLIDAPPSVITCILAPAIHWTCPMTRTSACASSARGARTSNIAPSSRATRPREGFTTPSLATHLGHLRLRPGAIRVELPHGQRGGAGAWPEVLLVHDAVVIDDEGHHAGHAVLGGERDEREARDHLATRDVVVLAARGIGPLRRQDAVEIAVERCRPRLLAPVPLGPGADDQVAQRAGRLSGLGGPVEPVALAGRAAEMLGVLEETVAVAVLGVVLALRVHVGQARLHRVELVPADAPRDDLLATLSRIEPPALADLHERDGERPVIGADVDHPGVAAGREPVRRVVRGQEPLPALPVDHRIARLDERPALAAEDPHQGFGIARAQGGDEGLQRLLGRREALRLHHRGLRGRRLRRCRRRRVGLGRRIRLGGRRRLSAGRQAGLQSQRGGDHEDEQPDSRDHRRPPPRPPPPPPPRPPPPPPPPARLPPPPPPLDRLMLWRLALPRLLKLWASRPPPPPIPSKALA